jgi:CRISPR/Cas system-associated exonuclease Cas4 (RecB family)
MHVGVEKKDLEVQTILATLNQYVHEEMKLEEFLIQLLSKNIGCSDLLFIILQKLRRDDYLESKSGYVKVNKKIDDFEIEKILSEVRKELERNRRLFISPLEVSKFFQCPRRLWLEKIALSREYKEAKGKVWDGEALHSAINLLIRNFYDKEIEILSERICTAVMKKYENKISLKKERLKNFIKNFYFFLKSKNPIAIFSEKKIEALRIGLVGTPDIIVICEKEIFVIDIKFGKVGKRIKEEHLLQIVGESILVENFFRRKVKICYLIYFESDSATQIEISEDMKKKFLNYKKSIGKMLKSPYIPEKSKLPNYRKRVCLGCHVRPACDNIEELKKIIY